MLFFSLKRAKYTVFQHARSFRCICSQVQTPSVVKIALLSLHFRMFSPCSLHEHLKKNCSRTLFHWDREVLKHERSCGQLYIWKLGRISETVLVMSTEFRTDRPIRTKMAGECENSSILRWQVRLLQIRVRNVLVTDWALSFGQFLVPRCCHITLNIFNVILFAVKSL